MEDNAGAGAGPDRGPGPGGGPAAHRPRPWVGLVAGLGLFLLALALPAPEGMTAAAWRVAAVALLMAVWWISEALPLATTALVPLVLFPLMEVVPMREAAAPYANPLIFLFMGGFMIALAMERCLLHRRIGFYILSRAGSRPHALVAGFMLATAGLSMWISNTATTALMLPIALSVIRLIDDASNAAPAPLDAGPPPAPGAPGAAGAGFAVALLLGIAYAASIGGLATLVGTPPNALLAAYMDQTYGVEVGFAQWMMVGVPLSAVMLVLAWALLVKVAYPLGTREVPGARRLIAAEITALGPPSAAERRVAAVFALVAGLWILRPLLAEAAPGLSDPGIAVFGGLLLFVIPAGGGRALLDWEGARRLPWNVLILMGGGLSLGAAITASGLSEWIAAALSGLGDWPLIAIIAAVAATVMVVSHVTSNTATAAAFIPLIAALAVSLGQDPFLLLVPTVLAASTVFMLPVATPPNAIVFGSGMITAAEMARAGALLNLAALALIPAAAYVLVAAAFGAAPGVLPAWAMP